LNIASSKFASVRFAIEKPPTQLRLNAAIVRTTTGAIELRKTTQKQKAATDLSMRVNSAYNGLVAHLEKK